jgi:hypothetical protein
MNTFNLKSVNEASEELIGQNAEYLIKYIYEKKTVHPYTDPLIRIGLALKTLLKAHCEIPLSTISPVMDDLTEIINQATDPAIRKVYLEELKFLQSCSINDDLISLNTTNT